MKMRSSAVSLAMFTMLPLLGCATVSSRWRAAEAMNCPEDQLQRAKTAGPNSEGEQLVAAGLLVSLSAATGRPLPLGPGAQHWEGCGLAFDCDDQTCSETARSRMARLTRSVPTLMLKSRDRAGPAAHTEQISSFTWQLESPRGTTECHVVTEELYRCTVDLEAPVAGPIVVAATPSEPPPPEPSRRPLPTQPSR